MNNPFELIDARLSNIENLLLDLKQSPKSESKQPEPDELLTVQDAAKFLSLTVPTIYGLISKGALPVMKRSKRCYFSKVDLMQYLKAGKRKSNTEIDLAASEFTKGRAL